MVRRAAHVDGVTPAEANRPQDLGPGVDEGRLLGHRDTFGRNLDVADRVIVDLNVSGGPSSGLIIQIVELDPPAGGVAQVVDKEFDHFVGINHAVGGVGWVRIGTG